MRNNILSLQPDYSESLDYDIRKIKRELVKITESFFYIGLTLSTIKKQGYFGQYENIYELSSNEFDLKRTAVKNLISVYMKYKTEDGFRFRGAFKEYNYSQLVEMLPLENNFILNNIPPSTSISKIRDIKYNLKSIVGQTSDQAIKALGIETMSFNEKPLKEIEIFNMSDDSQVIENLLYEDKLNERERLAVERLYRTYQHMID